jgi:hypothetical protein
LVIGRSWPPLMGFCGTSRTRTRRTRAGMGFRPTRTAFCAPRGCSSSEPPDRPKPTEGPPCAFAPLQRHVSSAPHRALGARGRSRCSSVSAMLPLLGFRALRHMPVGDSALGQRVPPPPRAASEVWLPPSRPSSPTSRRRSAGASLGFALQGFLLVRKRCPSRGPCPPDVTRAASLFPREQALLEPPPGLRACDEFVLPPRDRGRLAVDTFLGFPPSERSPHTSGLSLVVTMPALSSLGGVTSLPAWTSRLRGTHGSAGPFPSCQLSWGFAPSDRPDTPFIVPGSGLMVSPRAGCCLTGSPAALFASSDPMQSRFLGS